MFPYKNVKSKIYVYFLFSISDIYKVSTLGESKYYSLLCKCRQHLIFIVKLMKHRLDVDHEKINEILKDMWLKLSLRRVDICK